MQILIIILHGLSLFAADLKISVFYPFVMAYPPIDIATLNNDLENSFLMGFSDGRVRRYSADFSSYASLAVPEVVEKFSSFCFSLPNIPLSDGTSWSMLGNMTTTLSNTRTTFRVYSYPDFLPIDSLTFPESIIDYYGVPLGLWPSLTPLHLLTLEKAIKVVYRGVIYTVFDPGGHIWRRTHLHIRQDGQLIPWRSIRLALFDCELPPCGVGNRTGLGNNLFRLYLQLYRPRLRHQLRL